MFQLMIVVCAARRQRSALTTIQKICTTFTFIVANVFRVARDIAKDSQSQNARAFVVQIMMLRTNRNVRVIIFICLVIMIWRYVVDLIRYTPMKDQNTIQNCPISKEEWVVFIRDFVFFFQVRPSNIRFWQRSFRSVYNGELIRNRLIYVIIASGLIGVSLLISITQVKSRGRFAIDVVSARDKEWQWGTQRMINFYTLNEEGIIPNYVYGIRTKIKNWP